MTKQNNHAITSPQQSLYDLDLPAIAARIEAYRQPRYRAQQIWEWIYIHLVDTYDQMTNLPTSLQERLATEAPIDLLSVAETIESHQGQTRKDLLTLTDGETIEAVLMRYTRRRTACISTQVGCAMGCTFCATGQMGFKRNLSTGEIIAQVLHFARILQRENDRLTNVVLMGMGEPLLNYTATIAAIRRLIDPQGFNLGQRHITLSTVGIIPGIRKLAQEGLQITLAISLHAATKALRNQLIPINRKYDLDALWQACHDYIAQTNRRVSFEWAMIAGINDTPQQAHALSTWLNGLLAHVNLIPLNPTSFYEGQPPTQNAFAHFTTILDQHHIPYTIRLDRGTDIQAGCGQLRQRAQNT